MNKHQFISKLQKELNAIFNPECEVEVRQCKSDIIVRFYRKTELEHLTISESLGYYSIHHVEYNEKRLLIEKERANIIKLGYTMGRAVERSILLDRIQNVIEDACDEEARE